MALQGTLETFSLPDVLRLLASTNKTGCLRLQGDRGNGSVWVTEGAIIDSTAEGAPLANDASEVVFELLRFSEGEFLFDDGDDAPDAGDPAPVEDVLGTAESMLEEWRDLEKVVPSSQHWARMADTIAGDEVTISADNWRALAAIGSGDSIAGLGESLDLGEVPVARLVKALVEQGLVTVEDAPEDVYEEYEEYEEIEEISGSDGPSEVPEAPRFDDETDDASFAEADDLISFDDPDRAEDLITFEEPQGVEDPQPVQTDVEPEPVLQAVPDDDPVVEAPEAPIAAEAEPTLAEPPAPGEAAEIARQLANLSPKAARAVAAAAKANTPEEREAALAEVEASDDQINRDLLLKFLGSQS